MASLRQLERAIFRVVAFTFPLFTGELWSRMYLFVDGGFGGAVLGRETAEYCCQRLREQSSLSSWHYNAVCVCVYSCPQCIVERFRRALSNVSVNRYPSRLRIYFNPPSNKSMARMVF